MHIRTIDAVVNQFNNATTKRTARRKLIRMFNRIAANQRAMAKHYNRSHQGKELLAVINDFRATKIDRCVQKHSLFGSI